MRMYPTNRNSNQEPNGYCYELKCFGNVEAFNSNQARDLAIDEIISMIRSGRVNIRIIPIPE